jgi:hypothetical protein
MTRRRLKISESLSLPDDFVTKTAAILAQRRKGKTYTASVLAEELYAAKIPFVVLDPTGAWWGLRAGAEGKGPGLKVTILGGEHGDIPLERTFGKLAAELVVDHPGFYVIDFRLFESNEAERHFAMDFGEKLYRLKGRPGDDFPLHLIVDEADKFVPQRPGPGDQRMLGAFEAIVKRGGLRGLGTTLISQRAASVNKNVLEQIDVLIALRTVGPNDRKAIDGYVTSWGDETIRAELLESISSLALGEAWIWEPGGEPALLERVKIRARKTFNSSATPKPGEKRVTPQQLAPVELQALGAQWAGAIQRAEAEDPKKLQARIRELETELKSRPAETVEKIVEVAHVPPELIAALDKGGRRLEAVLAAIKSGLENEANIAARAGSEIFAEIARLAGKEAARVEKPQPRQPVARGREIPPALEPPKVRLADRRAALEDPQRDGISSGARKMLAAIALHHPNDVPIRQATMAAGFSRKSSQPSVVLRELRAAEFVEQIGKNLRLTEAGIREADVSAIPTSPGELLTYWRGRLGEGERRFLDFLVDRHPNAFSVREIAEQLGYSTASSQPTVIVRNLRDLGLIEPKGDGTFAARADLVEGYA